MMFAGGEWAFNAGVDGRVTASRATNSCSRALLPAARCEVEFGIGEFGEGGNNGSEVGVHPIVHRD
jgi:hypothetical protein